MSKSAQLKINEIFYSLQGESTSVGIPTVFIRLTACPLRCRYCDTSYAFKTGHWQTIENIIQQLTSYQCQYITVTGGEPLAQKNCLLLLNTLVKHFHHVSLETSGALDISNVHHQVIKVMDIKTPDSGEEDKNHYANIDFLTSKDQVKFVLCSDNDYQWAKSLIQKYQLNSRCEVLLSPVHQQYSATQLAENILHDKLPVRMQIQLHKYLWGDIPGK